MKIILEIMRKELRENFQTLRFYLVFFLVIVLFVVSSIVFVKDFKQKILDYRNDVSKNESLLNDKGNNLCMLARSEQYLSKNINSMEILSEANEKYLPNIFYVNIFSLSFPQVEGRGNCLLREFENIDWGFIVAVVLSFLALVFSYDSVCGEKEQKTLSIIFSNSVKTIHVFLGKFVGLLISVYIPFLVGIIFGLIIINLISELSIDYEKIILFAFISLVYIALFLLVGMTISSIFYQPLTSAITLLFIWVITAYVIPTSGGLIARNLYPILARSQIEDKISATLDDIYKTKYSKTKAGNAAETFIRSQFEEDKIGARNRIFDDYLNKMIQQAERTKKLTRISPVCVFRYLVEEISGTGVNRFKAFYIQVNQYKKQLYKFVEAKDGLDPKSHHLIPLALNLGMGISKLPVEFSSIPKFEERVPKIKDNFKKILFDLVILLIYCIVVFWTGYILFVRYDKR